MIEADFWEAVATGCTELFPVAPIRLRRFNPSKCLCVLEQLSEGRGAMAGARSDPAPPPPVI